MRPPDGAAAARPERGAARPRQARAASAPRPWAAAACGCGARRGALAASARGAALPAPAAAAFTSSPSPASTAITWLTGTSAVPSGTTILASVPSSTASTSMVALSVSISAMTSPDLTLSPSFLSHLARLPFSIVGDSAGMRMLIGMASALLRWRVSGRTWFRGLAALGAFTGRRAHIGVEGLGDLDGHVLLAQARLLRRIDRAELARDIGQHLAPLCGCRRRPAAP